MSSKDPALTHNCHEIAGKASRSDLGSNRQASGIELEDWADIEGPDFSCPLKSENSLPRPDIFWLGPQRREEADDDPFQLESLLAAQ